MLCNCDNEIEMTLVEEYRSEMILGASFSVVVMMLRRLTVMMQMLLRLIMLLATESGSIMMDTVKLLLGSLENKMDLR